MQGGETENEPWGLSRSKYDNYQGMTTPCERCACKEEEGSLTCELEGDGDKYSVSYHQEQDLSETPPLRADNGHLSPDVNVPFKEGL